MRVDGWASRVVGVHVLTVTVLYVQYVWLVYSSGEERGEGTSERGGWMCVAGKPQRRG